jgi:hypothetical protein
MYVIDTITHIDRDGGHTIEPRPVRKNGSWPLLSLVEPTQLAALKRWTNEQERKFRR